MCIDSPISKPLQLSKLLLNNRTAPTGTAAPLEGAVFWLMPSLFVEQNLKIIV